MTIDPGKCSRHPPHVISITGRVRQRLSRTRSAPGLSGHLRPQRRDVGPVIHDQVGLVEESGDPELEAADPASVEDQSGARQGTVGHRNLLRAAVQVHDLVPVHDVVGNGQPLPRPPLGPDDPVVVGEVADHRLSIERHELRIGHCGNPVAPYSAIGQIGGIEQATGKRRCVGLTEYRAGAGRRGKQQRRRRDRLPLIFLSRQFHRLPQTSKPMGRNEDDLRRILRRIDGRGYPAYRDLKGTWILPRFKLIVRRVQGDPFAAPSRISVILEPSRAGFAPESVATASRRTGLSCLLARSFAAEARKIRPGRSARGGSGRSGEIFMTGPGQVVLPQHRRDRRVRRCRRGPLHRWASRSGPARAGPAGGKAAPGDGARARRRHPW